MEQRVNKLWLYVSIYRMADMKRELDEVTRAKDALERLSYNIIDDLRQTKSKMENQQADFQQNNQDFKNRSKKLEEENRQMVRLTSYTFPKIKFRLCGW